MQRFEKSTCIPRRPRRDIYRQRATRILFNLRFDAALAVVLTLPNEDQADIFD
jgi:hypothetical protein